MLLNVHWFDYFNKAKSLVSETISNKLEIVKKAFIGFFKALLELVCYFVLYKQK